MTAQKPYPGIKSVIRAITILRTFDSAKPEWGFSELPVANDLNKITVFRLLLALKSEASLSVIDAVGFTPLLGLTQKIITTLKLVSLFLAAARQTSRRLGYLSPNSE